MLSPDQIRTIREMRAAGAAQRDIADLFGISRVSISLITRGITHPLAGGPIVAAEVHVKLDESQVREIRRLRVTGMTHLSIASLFGVSEDTVLGICSRRFRRSVP